MSFMRKVTERAAEPAFPLVPIGQHGPTNIGGIGPFAEFRGDQHRIRLTPIGDDDSLTFRDSLQKASEVGLRLDCTDIVHDATS
jgi:hypothetical protein